MHKRRLAFLLSLLIMTALIVFVGCGDDDECPTCPSGSDTVTISETVIDTLTDTLEVPQAYLAWTNAYIQLSPEFCFEAWIFAHAGANPFLDSAMVGDSVFYDFNDGYWYHESDPYFYMSECEDAATPQYSSGDTGVVTLYGSNLSSTCEIVLLDWYNDEAIIRVPDDGDTTILYNGTGFTCHWSYIENAEWYGVELNYHLDSAGTTIYRDIYTYSLDTTYTVADTIDGFAVEYVYLYALPTTGPDPESGVSNWTGELTTGKLYSIGDYAMADVYYSNPTAAKVVTVTPQSKPEKSAKEIIEGVIDTYSR